MSNRGFNPNGGIQLLPQQQAPAGPMFNVGPLMNDVQLVAWIAASIPGPVDDAVDRAQDIVAASQRKVLALGKKLAAANAAVKAEAEEAAKAAAE